MPAEKKKLKIPLKKFFPDGFDKTNPDDMMKLTVLIQEKAAQDPRYEGYSVFSVDPDNQYAIIAPVDMDGDDLNDGIKAVKLSISECSEPAAQKKTVTNLENMPQYEGYSVVDFIRVGSAECLVLLQQLDEKASSARRIFADVLGVKPWNIRITRTPENGWKIRIKEGSVTYQASRFDRKMQEAVEVVGKKGWFFKADPETGVIMVYPGTPPTFPKTIPVPKRIWDRTDLRHAYFGMKLPDKGRETGDLLYNDWKQGPGVLVAGATNGGKSVVINSLIYSALKAGCQLIICDDEDKAADFKWCRPWVMDKGWGCDGIEYCAATLEHVLDLCKHRANVIKQYDKMNWWGLPDDVIRENPPILLVCDEIAQWASPITVPAGLSKDNPTRISGEYEKGVHAMNFIALKRISQKARFAGIFFLYATQSATAPNGLDPSVRTNLTSKILVGAKVQDAVRENVLNDAKNAPKVEENIIREGRSVGTGVAELVGQEACVYKGFYEEDKSRGMEWADILREHLEATHPAPGGSQSGRWSWEEVVNAVPAAAEKPDDGGMYADGSDADRKDGFPTDGFGEDGRDVADRDQPLKGAAAAAHASRLYAAGVGAKHVSAVDAARTFARLSAQEGL